MVAYNVALGVGQEASQEKFVDAHDCGLIRSEVRDVRSDAGGGGGGGILPLVLYHKWM